MTTENPLKPGYSRKTIAENPIDYVLMVFNPASGATGYWTGKNWDTEPEKALRSHRREAFLETLYDKRKTVPPGWRIGIAPAPDFFEPEKPARAGNPKSKRRGSSTRKTARGFNPVHPSTHAKLKEASERYADFRGENAEHVDTVKNPAVNVALEIGKLDGVLYTTRREGKIESYIHRFRKKSRPLLCASHDGKQLVIVGGRYRFTERGIVDE